MKLCVDCKHYRNSGEWGVAMCEHPRFTSEPSPIHGRTHIDWKFCVAERRGLNDNGQQMPDACGPDARHFEPLPPNPAGLVAWWRNIRNGSVVL